MRASREAILSAVIGTILVPVMAAGPSAKAKPYDVVGPGAISCGSWLDARRQPEQALALSDSDWVLGYITAYNEYVAGDGHIDRGTDAEGIDAWIDKYCLARPLDTVADAARALVKALKARAP